MANITFTTETFTETVIQQHLSCNRCNGTGYLQQHRRISGGVCFKCDGKGTSNKTKTVIHTNVDTTYHNATILENDKTFDEMFNEYQAKKEAFNIQDWFTQD